MKQSLAVSIARHTLLSVLPPGVPPSWAAITGAEVLGGGKKRKIIASVLMFDGLPATVQFSRGSMGWSHRWINLPGGDCSFEDGRWIRIPTQERLFA